MDQQQSSLWSSNDTFTINEPLFDNVDYYCFDEPIFTGSISDSSDSGNYSPSATECYSSVFDLENAKYWQNSLDCGGIEGHGNNIQFSNKFSPQYLNQSKSEINRPNNTFIHQMSIASQQFVKPVMTVPKGNMVFVVKQPNQSSKLVQPPVTNQVLLPAQQTLHPIKAKARVMPSTSFILPPAASTPKIPIAQNNTEEDNFDFYKKKEERKMRNRVSAHLSRQRKKNEEANVKKELENTSKRCTELEKENEKLKIRIRQLEYENKKLLELNGANLTLTNTKDGDIRHKNAAKTAGVCMFLLFTWMVLPDFNVNEPQQQLLHQNKLLRHENDHQIVIGHGRLLQSTNSTYERTKNFGAHSTGLNHTLNHNGTFGGCCGFSNRFYNETLKLKLSEDLLTWIDRHEILELELPQLRHGKLQPILKTNNAGLITTLAKIRINSKDFDAEQNNGNRDKHTNKGSERKYRIRNGMRQNGSFNKQRPINKSMGDLRRVIGIPANNNGPGSFFSRQQMTRLMKSIKGNGETEQNNILFLIPKDYLLLPPSNIYENSTIQLPKLSIILPALSPPLKSSEPFNQLAMIRIDADVIGTKFFYLQQKLIKSLLKVQTLSTF